MKELIRFSLKRRFANRSTKLFNVIILIAIIAASFSDLIITFLNPSFFEKEVVYTKGIDDDLFAYLNEQAQEEYSFQVSKKKTKELVEENHMVLTQSKEGFVLHSKYVVSPLTLQSFSMQISRFHKDKVMDNAEDKVLLEAYNQEVMVKNEASNDDNEISNDKSTLIFMFVTSVYFMMLSFISGVASEVVNEKATKTLELILTSVSAKMHFYAKLSVGWLVIVIQFLLSASYVLFALLLRSVYDEGRGLITLLKQMNILEIKGDNFYSVLLSFDFTTAFFIKLASVILFLLIGIIIAQLVLVIFSSFVSNMEEASNIQAPFYLLLLGFYYFVLAINNPYELSEGIGYYLSFVPFMNMLLMPCRILIQEVALLEMLISFVISIFVIVLIAKKGCKVYEQGVLDYSCKGFLSILKSIKKS